MRYLMVVLGVALLVAAICEPSKAALTIDADSQYRYAQSRFQAGAFDEAIAEFDRFIHFFPSDPRIPQARFQIGMAHFKAGRYPAAAAVFSALTAHYSGSSLDNQAYFMLSRCHARQGMIEQAIVDLHNLMAFSPPTDVVDRARYELGWLHVDEGRWSLADQAFSRITIDNRERLGVDDLQQILAQSDRIPMKQPTTAGLLSVIPGGGQLYCGRYQDALTAFLFNGGLIWAAWESFDKDLYALGGVIGFVEFGFYAGNIYGAISDAYKYNREQAGLFRQRLYAHHRQLPLSLAPVPGGAALFLSFDF
jgi:outer membrane protein assembly factor BamD (BamD/ComL family)